MTDNVENLILERLRRIDDRLGNIEGDMRDIKLRMTIVEEHIGNFLLSISGVSSRIDRSDERLQRIERRLDLSNG